jgi:hypothetical protein
MNRTRLARLGTLGCLILCVASTARADDLFLSAKNVVVSGVADIKAVGSKAAARDAAIRNAQRNAVEQVVGTLIESRFSVEQKETLKKQQNEFTSTVEDKIYTKSSGFIDSQTILDEQADGDTYRVTLRVSVKAAPLEQELQKLQSLYKAANYPKVMLLVTERYTDKAGAARWIDRPSIAPAIESELLKLGIALAAKDQVEKLARESLEVLAEAAGKPSKAAQIAASHGAEVVIIGSAEVSFSAFNELNTNMYYLSATVSLRAINASTAAILASVETVGKGIGVSEEIARVNAVKDASPKVVKSLIDGLVAAWQKGSQRGNTYKVVLLNVKSYGQLGLPFIEILQRIPDVENARELSFGGKRLEVEVVFKGDKSTLIKRIFGDAGKIKKFEKLDKVLDRGDAVELTL